MNNYDSPANVVELTVPSGGVVAGQAYKIGRILGVATVTVTAAQVTADATITANFLRVGKVDLLKVAAEPWTQGCLVWYNTDSKLCSSVSTTSMLIGFAAEATVNPSSTGKVILAGAPSWLNYP